MPMQSQKHQPGLTYEMKPEPDHGEESYKGSGRLAGMRALLTGGDSGIGRAVAIAYAREGADLAIIYLPEEQEDAEVTKKWVTEAGRKCVLIPGDLREEEFCETAVKQALAELQGIDVLLLNAGTQRERDKNAAIDRSEIMKVFEVNLVAPLIPATGWENKLVHFGENTPIGRAGQPAELAGAYVYLASEDASYTSGAVLPVTGGKHV